MILFNLTDFSSGVGNGIGYAVNLAQQMNATRAADIATNNILNMN